MYIQEPISNEEFQQAKMMLRQLTMLAEAGITLTEGNKKEKLYLEIKVAEYRLYLMKKRYMKMD